MYSVCVLYETRYEIHAISCDSTRNNSNLDGVRAHEENGNKFWKFTHRLKILKLTPLFAFAFGAIDVRAGNFHGRMSGGDSRTRGIPPSHFRAQKRT
jgi:hypothetical protein